MINSPELKTVHQLAEHLPTASEDQAVDFMEGNIVRVVKRTHPSVRISLLPYLRNLFYTASEANYSTIYDNNDEQNKVMPVAKMETEHLREIANKLMEQYGYNPLNEKYTDSWGSFYTGGFRLKAEATLFPSTLNSGIGFYRYREVNSSLHYIGGEGWIVSDNDSPVKLVTPKPWLSEKLRNQSVIQSIPPRG